MKVEWWMVLGALALLGGKSSSAAPADEPPDDPPDDDVPADNAPDPECNPNLPYVYEGPDLAVPAGTRESFDLGPQQWAKANTILTQIINGAYKSPWNRCNREMVESAAQVGINDLNALAMMAYWSSVGLGTARPYPTKDPELTAQGEEAVLGMVGIINRLNKFFKAAETAFENA